MKRKVQKGLKHEPVAVECCFSQVLVHAYKLDITDFTNDCFCNVFNKAKTLLKVLLLYLGGDTQHPFELKISHILTITQKQSGKDVVYPPLYTMLTLY